VIGRCRVVSAPSRDLTIDWITMAPPGLNIGVPGWGRAMDALIEL
jgi:hypothetical protein